MSNPPVSDRALRSALSLPGVNAGASRAILVNRNANRGANASISPG